jgi:hypothetical protein
VLPKENPPGGGAGALLLLPPKLNAMLARDYFVELATAAVS